VVQHKDMDKKTEETLKHYYSKLPDAVKKILTAEDLQSRVLNIVKKHNLRVDEGGAVEDEVALVLLGIEHPKDFVSNIIENTNVDKKQAPLLARDINETIFVPIRGSLIGLHKKEAPENKNPDNSNKNNIKTSQKSEETVPTPTVPVNIMKEKLVEQTHTPEEKKTIEKPKKYEQDPYREPIK